MTSIKPPDGRSPASPLGPTAGREAEGAEKTTGPGFRELLEGTRPADAAGTAVTSTTGTAATSADPVGALARAVRAGAISPQQAIEQLVERAASGVGRSLSEAQRAELVTVLREAVQTDPALRELREAIG